MIPAIDNAAKDLFALEPQLAVDFLTGYSVSTANKTVLEWKDFYGYLFTRFMDGNVKEATEVPEGYIYHSPKLEQPGYSEDFYRKVVEDTGDKLKVTGSAH